MAGLKPILLVEDNPKDLELTMAALAKSKLANEIVVARDGLEVLAQIKGNPKTRHIPVVMLTSSSEEQDILRSYKLGVNAFVVKPVGFQEFFEAIRDLGVFWA